jgi:hypothetical protein
LTFGFGGWAPSLVVELPAVEALAFTFGFGGWVLGLAVELLAVEVVALTFGFDGWSGVLAVVLLLVAFEVGFGDWVGMIVGGRYASLTEVYVS